MADDQNKTSTIDDLVKELSKNNSPNPSRPLSDKPAVSQGPPPNLPGVKVEPKSTIPPAVSPQPMPPNPQPVSGVLGVLPRPPMPPRPSLKPTEGTAKPSPVQEYRSSIRTMGEDIASLKSGQKPSGVDIPRKVTPEAPKPAIPGAPKPETQPSGPISSVVGLGKTEKTGLLPGLPKPTIPSIGRPGPTPGLGQAGKTGPLPPPAGGPPILEKPSKPFSSAGPFKTPEIQPSITVPGEKRRIGMIFYLLIASVLVIGGFLYWFLILRTTVPKVVLSPTPTPTQTITPTPVIKNLSDIFEGTPVNFEVILSDNLGKDFKTFISTLSVTRNKFLKVNLVRDIESTLVPLSFLDMLDMGLAIPSTVLSDNVVDSIVIVSDQSEAFNADGSINFNVQGIKRTTFVARVKDVAAVELAMSDWELTIADDLADYLLIADTSKKGSVNFMGNTYRGTSIKYKNFPSPDVTVDYAIVEAADQNYLVIAGSREAAYAIIDALLAQ